MRKLIFILLLFPVLVFSQNEKTKFQYREAPRTGEIIAIAGIGLIALTATGLLHNEKVPTSIPKTIGFIGGGLVFAGVVIDLNRDNKRFKYKHKGKRNRIRIRF